MVEDHAWRYLHYLRASLADGARLAPRPEEGIEAETSSLLSGKVGPATTTDLFRLAKADKPHGTEEEELWPLKVLVCPYVYALRPGHGRHSTRLPNQVVPIVLSARLYKDGSLGVDENCLLPLIPRDYLEPFSCDVVIGSLEDADRTYATLETAVPDWRALVSRAHELIAKVSNQDPEALVLEQYEKLPNGVCLLQKLAGSFLYMERLLDVMLEGERRTYPLLNALLTSAPDLPIKTAAECLAASALHLGQMECEHPLSKSQREALVHHLAPPAEAPDILAIDGPPGTGKTTLLLSVIATLWVQRALDEGEAPLIVAMATNNKAVVNIVEACLEIKEPEGALSGRWLPGIRMYGQLIPAEARVKTGKTKEFHSLTFSQAGIWHDAQGFENPEGLRQARAHYLERFLAAYPQTQTPDLEGAKRTLHDKLTETVARIRAAVDALSTMASFIELPRLSRASCEACASQFETHLQELSAKLQLSEERFRRGKSLRRDWKKHLSTEPLWRALLAAVGFESPRRRWDELFCANAVIEYEDLLADRLRNVEGRSGIDLLIEATLNGLEAEARTAAELLRSAQLKAQRFSRAHDELKSWYSDGCDGSLDAIQAALDLGLRYRAFKLATHYWEARYLLEVEEKLVAAGTMDDTRNPMKLERLYRRLAKLFPYSVSTAFTLPGRFTGWLGEEKPLFGKIDLLIVDEAGQISPEVGVLPFALAKRALVVGDVDQLRPIWAIPAPLDSINALRFGVINSSAEQLSFPEQALAVSGSSLMRIAQRATPFSQYPQRGRGMLLREHRRCWPEIINICNALVYRGLLIPKRTATREADDGTIEDDRRFVPSVGYVHIPGTDQYRGRSRYNLAEAAAVAKWLARRRGDIEKAFIDQKKQHFNQLVAVVTPFVAQARAIRASLASEFGSDHGITVGTVDALQGAQYRVVLFSPTYGIGTRPGATRFDRNPSFLNVAISRAQDVFLVFGNMHLFKPRGTHPSAVVGRFLFAGGENELKDIPVELLLPGLDLPPGRLIHDLESHRAVLTEAFGSARFRLVVVSPFLTSDAIMADEIPAQIRRATQRGVSVKIVSDAEFNTNQQKFEECAQALVQAGAEVRAADGPSVHSKLILVDSSWLVVGSFNWLSSPRDPRSRYVRHEASIRYDGNEAFEMIRSLALSVWSLTPRTIVASSLSLAGALRMTRSAPASRCF